MAVLESEPVQTRQMPRREPTVADAPLPDGYYVRAFNVVLETVAASSSDLLIPAEHEWLEQIYALSDPGRRLYVRLLQRRAVTFRVSKLSYKDVPDVLSAGRELVKLRLANDVPPHEIKELAEAFTVPELERLAPSGCPRSARRSERIVALCDRNAVADVAALAGADHWLTINGHACFTVFRLCFFGNLHQDLSEFVTTALGTHRYEVVPLDHSNRYFRSRCQLDAHLRYHECSLLFHMRSRHNHESLQQLVSLLPTPVDDDPHLERRLDRLRIEIARTFERLKDDEAAHGIYTLCRRAPARERCVRLLERIGRAADADALLHRMLLDPDGEAEHDFARRRLSPHSATSKAFRPRTTALVLPVTTNRVEHAAAEYFARDGSCHWVENRLLTSLLGLWIWDILFLPIRGAFFYPFHSGPTDFRERSFRVARKEALAERFAAMHESDVFEQRVSETLRQCIGISNPLVSWELAASPILEHALARIPKTDLAAVFERMLDDPAQNTSGLPDLVHFPNCGGYELIEIKGPGDALQANQRRWFRHFDTHSIPARVVKVRWTEVNG